MQVLKSQLYCHGKLGRKTHLPALALLLYVNNYTKEGIHVCNFFPTENHCTLGLSILHYGTHFAKIVSASSQIPSTCWPNFPSLSNHQQARLILLVCWEVIHRPAQVLSKGKLIMIVKGNYQYSRLSKLHLGPVSQINNNQNQEVFLSSSLLQGKKRGKHRKKRG